MIRSTLAVVALSSLLLACQQQAAAPAEKAEAPASSPSPAPALMPMPGQPAPAFTLVDADGVQRSLSDFRGKVVVLEWTNEGCPYVQKHYSGAMQALQREAAEDGVVWLSIISSAPGKQGYVEGQDARDWKTRTRANAAHLLLDPTGQVGRTYGAKTTPDMRVIDREGRLVFVGGIDDKPTVEVADLQGATNFVRSALDDVMSERPLRTDLAAPYGCSIKYADEDA
ncbi:thioredoxin family protein [Brevundimonas sp. GCM10030266]|uniref:thioredoxin family protein n=1 Tax=Brevundimonas sp. GCM10030266 TaxID=3273386 RepID=UPI003613B84A